MDDDHQLKTKVISGLVWKFLERIGVQFINFTISIIVARQLFPADYGLVTLITIFISYSLIFVNSGFTSALIQKKEVDSADFSSVFYFSLFMSALFYITLFLLAPTIADFYNESLLVPIIRIQGITIILGSVTAMQNTIITRNLEYKKGLYINIGSVTASAIVAIPLAYLGYGVWALVWSSLTLSAVSLMIMTKTVKWTPTLEFSAQRLKKLFGFGSKLLLSELISTTYVNMIPLIIGKVYNPASLALYNRGQQFPALLISNIDYTIINVMFPALARYQDEVTRMKSIIKREVRTSSFIVFPVLVGLAVIAEPLILFVLTDKWIEAVPFLQLFCIYYIFYPIQTANLVVIKALGRSDLYLLIDVIKFLITILVVLITMNINIYVMTIGVVSTSFIAMFINSYPNRKLIHYPIAEQLKDVASSFVLAIMMGAVIYPIMFLALHPAITIAVQVLVGVSFYFLCAWLFKMEVFTYLLKEMNLAMKGNQALKKI